MVVYVDDSVGIAPRSLANYLFNAFVDLVDRLGILLSATPGHVIRPSTVVTALGLQFDTVSNIISLPPAKLIVVRQLLADWLEKETASPRDLASLAGRLLWCLVKALIIEAIFSDFEMTKL